jgi:hypothetical protein
VSLEGIILQTKEELINEKLNNFLSNPSSFAAIALFAGRWVCSSRSIVYVQDCCFGRISAWRFQVCPVAFIHRIELNASVSTISVQMVYEVAPDTEFNLVLVDFLRWSEQ